MDHSYEEIRAATLDILAGREKVRHEAPCQFMALHCGVAELLGRRENPAVTQMLADPRLSRGDALIFMEVFWDLFLQRIITIGLDDSNREFPWFRVSSNGKRILANQDTYFFHDVSSYERLVQTQIPKIDHVTLDYVKEAMQAFRAGCILSATVMLGVATEHTFVLLLETIDGNPKHQQRYAPVRKERSILPKFNKFQQILLQDIGSLPSDVKEDLDTQFAAILSVIRTFRNQAGHPTGKIIDREQVYVLLNLFVPYCRKCYSLIEHFSV